MFGAEKNVALRKKGIRFLKECLWPVLRLVILGGLCYLLVYPLLLMLATAFRAEEDLFNPAVVWITRNYTLEHVKKLMEVIQFPVAFKNSLLISLGSAVAQTTVCSLVGYGFARFKFKGREVLFLLVIFTVIVPPQVLISSLYMIFRFFHIPIYSWFAGSVNFINSPWTFWLQGLLGMGIRSGLFIFIYRQFYRNIPSELENAALIDGCNALKTYLLIMLPNAKMIIVTVFMFSLVWHWNDSFSVTFLMPQEKTLAGAISMLPTQVFQMADVGDENPMLYQVRMQAGALMTIIPMLVLFAFTQKTFTESVERTGIVG